MRNRPYIVILLLLLPLMAFGAKKKRAAAVDPQQQIAIAREAIAAYRPEEAIAALGKIRSADATVDSLTTMAERMESLMQRVDAVEVIDSVNVSRNDFFNVYRLSSVSGAIFSGLELPEKFDAASETTVFVTELGSTMMWGGSDGLYQSRRLTDGTWEEPAALSETLNAGGVANFPFLMPDGVTLYYATEGEDGLGGYDIYVSRRNGEEFPTPQNMGMPYNSPYDDLLLAIDEETGAGWFASDRNDPGGDITVYIFIPTEARKNVDIDAPNLSDRARLASIKDTWTDAGLRQIVLQRVVSVTPTANDIDDTPDFEFIMPDGRTLCRWAEFKNPQARRVMENYIDTLEEQTADAQRLDTLYANRARGDRSKDNMILQLEKKQKSLRSQLLTLSNKIISLEK